MNDQERKRAEEITIEQLQEKYNTRELENHFKDLDKGKDEDEAKFYFTNWQLVLSILNTEWRQGPKSKDPIAKELERKGIECKKVEGDFYKIKDKDIWIKTSSLTPKTHQYWSGWDIDDYNRKGRNSYLFLFCGNLSTVLIIPPSDHNKWFTSALAVMERTKGEPTIVTRIFPHEDRFELQVHKLGTKVNANDYINNYALIGMNIQSYAKDVIIEAHFLTKKLLSFLSEKKRMESERSKYIEKEIPLITKEIADREQTPSKPIMTEAVVEEQEEEVVHTKIQWLLIKLGSLQGFAVWVAVNDQNKTYNEEKFRDLCLKEIPHFSGEDVLAIAKRIDVIWFKKNSIKPEHFFEIEATTQVYSGLLRLNDIMTSYPLPGATIVSAEDRRAKFEKEINRPTFQVSELSEKCNFKSFDDIEEWYESQLKVSKFITH